MEFQKKARFYLQNKLITMNKLAIVALMFVSLVSGQNISVMTYNIKLDYPKEG